MCTKVCLTLFIVFVLNHCKGQEDQTPIVGRKGTKCYDDFNRPQRCIPTFENAAFDVLMEATNTCGQDGETEYCIQTGTSNVKKSCDVCLPRYHDSRFLTDFHNQDQPTWWQSETMFEGIQYPNQVNLTLKFRKAFDITYVRLWFSSPRPESFYISKKTTEDGPWVPYQYYSATCRDTYGLPDTIHTKRGEEARPLCASEYSDISPLTGGIVAFGTLEGRPSAYNFDASSELQEWVTATEIMITLDRLNTFGDEIFGDGKVLKSYFYAIADVAVGARCKCNGHASECITSTGLDNSKRRVCRCEHNTAGPDCNMCLPFFNDAPWARATAKNAHECKQCNCNGFSNRCFFDEELYRVTGHGGHCLDCSANRDGPNCERCRENYYMREDGYCVACDCDATGSRSLQCNTQGKCQCKPGVAGDKCDRCEVNFYDFSSTGCKSCDCEVAGSANNMPQCDPITGVCRCKENVEGRRCKECKPGYFNIDFDNEFGCTPCFCYGHSSECSSAQGYSRYQLESPFAKNNERWSAVDEYNRHVDLKYDLPTQSIEVRSSRDESVYFVATDKYLGDQKASYNQYLSFTLRIGDNRPIPTATDIILEGNGNSVTNTIFAQQNKIPQTQNQEYKFRLHEHPDYGWQPRLSARGFMSILSNLTAVKIKGTYGPQGIGYLDDVKLETALRSVAGKNAFWVENCECPLGYVGQFCESCAPGFRHSPSLGGSFMPCIPCDCNKHAEFCDSETGRCICHHNTAGDNCELCARGYYGNALGGTDQDCLPCGCPNGGACIQIDDDLVMCTECPMGYTGHRCDSCSDGYYRAHNGECVLCECNNHIDQNAIGNCNSTTGECLRCIHNTAGYHCDSCLTGYFGDPILPEGCKVCECMPLGTQADDRGRPICDQNTGSCNCKPHVVGRNCDQAEAGFYNMVSGNGAQPCNCDPIGSYNHTCNAFSGQCFCRPGVTGLRCDHCEPRMYGFSTDGCKACECDSIGSKDLQCDPNGQCPCFENVEGRRCDRCKENKYARQNGCIDCPDCYNLVQNAAHSHNDKLKRLNDILDDIERNPTVITDNEFPIKLGKLQVDINDFHDTVKSATGENSIIQQVHDIRQREKDITRTLDEIDENIVLTNDKNKKTSDTMFHVDDGLESVGEKILEVNKYFDEEGAKALEDARKRADLVGQQSDKMTEIAHEARDLADELDKRSEALISKIDESKNKSHEAYEKAKNATDMQDKINEEARLIKSELINLEQALNNTQEWTKGVAEKAKKAKADALGIVRDVDQLVVPQIDIPNLKLQSDNLQTKATELKEKAESKFHDTDELLLKIEERLDTGQDLLEKAKLQQEDTDQLMEEINAAKIQASKAILKGDKLFNDTQEILKILKDFDNSTQMKKKEAEDALKQIPEIQQIIQSTTEKGNDAISKLESAKINVKNALQKAVDADNLAKNSSANAQKIKNEAEMLHQNASKLDNEANMMFDRVTNTEGELKNLLGQSKSNDTLINQAKEKVGRAGKDTDEASKKVNELLSNVNSIIAELSNPQNLNEDEIEKFSEDIRNLEAKLKAARLEEKLDQLQQQHRSQEDLVEQHKRDIKRLQKDVDNIEQITRSLPNECFKRDKVLEP